MSGYRLVFRVVDRDKFDEIKLGLKTIETRAATIKYRAIKAGDTLRFTCGKDEVTKTITRVDHFSSLDDMFVALPLEKILPSVKSKEDAKSVYYGFPGYKVKIEAEGILAFSLAS